MSIEPAGIETSIKNVVHQIGATARAPVIGITGTYEAGKTITDEVWVISNNAQYTGSVYGFGSMLHRLHIYVEKGSYGQVPVWIGPQAEGGAAQAATGDVNFTVTTVGAGTLALYIGGERIPVTTTASMTEEQLCDACVAAINAKVDCNLSAAKHASTFELDLTSKTKGTYGNEVTVAFNLLPGDVTPDGISWVIQQPGTIIAGSGLPTVNDALEGMGTGDNKNSIVSTGITALVHGYLQDATTLNAIRDYVGVGDELVGCYAKTVARPFYSLTGDIDAGSAALTALVAVGEGRTTDRANGICPNPGGYTHPSEVAANAIGYQQRVYSLVSARSYGKGQLIGVVPGVDSDQWTNTETNRKTAINAGIGTISTDGLNVFMEDTVTFYHPNTIPENSNIYREISNIMKIGNILNSWKVGFNREPFINGFIVEDTTRISSAQDRAYAVDQDLVIATHYELIDACAAEGWLFEVDFAKENTVAAIRDASDGFDSVIKAILSGVSKRYNNQIQADISTAVLQ